MQQRTDAIDVRTLGDLVVSELRLLYGSKFAQAWEGMTPREVKDSLQPKAGWLYRGRGPCRPGGVPGAWLAADLAGVHAPVPALDGSGSGFP